MGNLPKNPEMFAESPISFEDFDGFAPIVHHLERTEMDTTQLKPEQKELLLKLALGFTPGLHKMVSMSPFLPQGRGGGPQRVQGKIPARPPGLLPDI